MRNRFALSTVCNAGVILSLLTAVCCASPATAASTNDVSSLLLKMTQEFSDAGQRGDGPTMARMLDDRVVFINEGGDIATKQDMVQGAVPPATGVSIKMTVTDWNCVLHGNVAVASFVDDQIVNTAGELMHAKYRSVETWINSNGDWRMIGSETIALQDDPPSVALSPAALDEYVGSYRSAAGTIFSFNRKGAELNASIGNGKPAMQRAEVKDVFFTPGRARMRKVFMRNETGAVSAFAYRREGHDTVFKRIAPAPRG